MRDATSRLLWIATLASVAILVSVWATHNAEIRYVPSILVFVTAMITTGVFATLEDHFIRRLDELGEVRSIIFMLYLIRIGRTVLLLLLGLLMFGLLAWNVT